MTHWSKKMSTGNITCTCTCMHVCMLLSRDLKDTFITTLCQLLIATLHINVNVWIVNPSCYYRRCCRAHGIHVYVCIAELVHYHTYTYITTLSLQAAESYKYPWQGWHWGVWLYCPVIHLERMLHHKEGNMNKQCSTISQTSKSLHEVVMQSKLTNLPFCHQ